MSEKDREAVVLRDSVLRQPEAWNREKFTTHAGDMLMAAVHEYVKSLIAEAEKFSARSNADVISATHVEQARGILAVSGTRRWFRHVGAVGGVLFGAAVSNTAAMVSIHQYSTEGVVASIVLGVAGAFGITLHAARD